jgi:hypothetical protein
MNIDLACQTRTYLGLYEVELNRHLRRILRPGIRSFDVGAQYGYDALVIAQRTGALVASFECDPWYVKSMCETFALNPGLAPLIEAVEAMVGPGGLGLDEWAYGKGFVPDFIKMDIEGGEYDALVTATRILGERHPSLVVEVHSLEQERKCGELLVRHGYRPIIVNQRGLWPDRRPTEHNRWLVAA